ncbi:MAG: SDR family oxidoreductase [Gemmatimonadota bacterium]|nr:SDR family oxidoreductase [Gemmatimonadota bacterium]
MRTIVVTGCSTGFGRIVSEQLARAGDRVYATMRGVDGKNSGVAAELRGLVQADGIDLRVLEMDVTSDASVEAAAETVVAESGAPDVVINNAGQMFMGIAEAFTPGELARQLDVNVVGVHRVTRAFLPSMRQAGRGLIINVSSIAGRMAVPFFSIYHASKWALEGYSLGLRAELASSGVDVVSVQPGPFVTELFGQGPAPADEDGRAATYPPSVPQARAEMDAAFEGIFADPDMPTDPQMVCDRMVELVNMAPGTRPFRSVVGVDFGVRERNDADAPMDAGVLDAMGLTEFATLRT